MIPSTKSLTRRLPLYLGAGIGAGCLAGHSEAAVVVTFYGPGAKSSATNPATPLGFNIGGGTGERAVMDGTTNAVVGYRSETGYFTRGATLVLDSVSSFPVYAFNGSPMYGALLNSKQNYATINFNGSDGTFEAVAQFYFDGNGGGYLVAIARTDDNTTLSIPQGKTAIDAVPEPSGLALLALGAGGLLARRRRGVAMAG